MFTDSANQCPSFICIFTPVVFLPVKIVTAPISTSFCEHVWSSGPIVTIEHYVNVLNYSWPSWMNAYLIAAKENWAFIIVWLRHFIWSGDGWFFPLYVESLLLFPESLLIHYTYVRHYFIRNFFSIIYMLNAFASYMILGLLCFCWIITFSVSSTGLYYINSQSV